MFRKLIALTAFVLLLTASVYGQNEVYPAPPANASESSLGSFLEPRFQTQLGVCITGTPNKMNLKLKKGLFSSDKILSAIPPQLKDPSVNLGGTVLLMPEWSVARAFAYVYPLQQMPASNINPPAEDYLVADYLENPRLLTQLGFNMAFYDYSCSMSIAAALKLNAGYSFPMAEVSSALQNDLNSKNSYRLALVSGTMFSPLWKMYNSTTNDDYKTYAQLLIWDWYRRHPNAVNDNKTRYLLTQFDGVSVYKVLTHSLTNDGKVNVSASASIPVVKLSGQLEAALNTSAEARVESFGLVARKASTGESLYFVAYPQASVIATLLSNSAKAHLAPNPDLRLAAVTRHTQVINGVPEAICTGNWSVEKVNSALGGTFSVTDKKWTDEQDGNNLPTCRLTVTYNTAPAVAGQLTPAQLNLDYYFVSELPQGKGNIRIKADTVSLSSSGLPSIQPATSPSVPVVNTSNAGGVNFHTFEWGFNFSVREDTKQSDKIGSVESVPSDLKLTCGAERVVTPLNGIFSYNSITSILSLSISHPTNDSVERLDMDKSALCTLSGRVTFTLNSGTQIQRDIQPAYAVYRQQSPVPSPTPAPSPSPSPTRPGF